MNVLLFIQKISELLTCLPHRRLSSKTWPSSWHGFRILNKCFTVHADTSQKVDNILRAVILFCVSLAFRPFRISQKFS